MDISLSRLTIAKHLVSIECQNNKTDFLGDLASIPLADNLIDISFTIGAIEPNGEGENYLDELIRN